jgi:VanZ family protein
MVFGMLYLIVFLKQFENQPISAKRKKVAQILGYLFLFSTFMQLISRSADERWNAIPAAVLAVTFFKLSKVKHK